MTTFKKNLIGTQVNKKIFDKVQKDTSVETKCIKWWKQFDFNTHEYLSLKYTGSKVLDYKTNIGFATLTQIWEKETTKVFTQKEVIDILKLANKELLGNYPVKQLEMQNFINKHV